MSIENPGVNHEAEPHADAGVAGAETIQPVTGGEAAPEESRGILSRLLRRNAPHAENDHATHAANDNHAHGHEHPGSLLGLWGFLFGKAWNAVTSGASSGGGHSAGAKKADSHGGGGHH